MKEKKSFYVCCPNCSKRLALAKVNSEIEIECPKCKGIINVVISSDNKVITQVIKEAELVNNYEKVNNAR